MPSSELPSANSLSVMGSLEAGLGVAGDLAGAGALAGMDALKTADRKPPTTGTSTKVGAGAVKQFAAAGSIA